MSRTFAERLEQLHLSEERVLYKLTVADALRVVADNLTQDQLDQLSDKQLEDLIETVGKNFGNTDWHDWGTAGFEYFMRELDEKEI